MKPRLYIVKPQKKRTYVIEEGFLPICDLGHQATYGRKPVLKIVKSQTPPEYSKKK
jgi:hypothetical protein